MSLEPPHTNGKATLGLVVQVGAVLFGGMAGVLTPLILMFSKLNTLEVTMQERMAEIETQFRALDEFHNLNIAQQHRTNALLWEETFHARYPSDVHYFPSISQFKTH